jgi:hypothetical protein
VHGARGLIEALAEAAVIDVADERIERPIVGPDQVNAAGKARKSGK